MTVMAVGSFTAQSIIDDGMLVVAAGGGLILHGSLGGNGQIDIGSGAGLRLRLPIRRRASPSRAPAMR
jgi:hypothetical protein